jgi:uncharacterized protein YbjT (DUF2867 family)
MAALALTGVTGRLGRRVADRLVDGGSTPRLLVRDPARAPALPGCEVVVAPYDDAQAVRRALEGIEVVLMVSASESPDRVAQHRAFVDGAVVAGVRHLMYTSFVGAGPDATFTLARDHGATEAHIRSAGRAWTFLRDNLYLDFLPLLAGADGVIRGPAGDGRVAAVAQDDIADVAAAVLRDPEPHAGRTYELTGPEALSLEDVAVALTAATGRPVRYERETVEEAYASRASYGAPGWQVDAWVSTYLAMASGELATVGPAVEHISGHPSRSLADLLRSRR